MGGGRWEEEDGKRKVGEGREADGSDEKDWKEKKGKNRRRRTEEEYSIIYNIIIYT